MNILKNQSVIPNVPRIKGYLFLKKSLPKMIVYYISNIFFLIPIFILNMLPDLTKYLYD